MEVSDMADVVKRVKQIMNIDWFEKVTDEDFIKDLVNDIRQDGAEKAEAELEAVKGRIERAIAFLQNTDCKEVYKITIIKLLKGGE